MIVTGTLCDAVLLPAIGLVGVMMAFAKPAETTVATLPETDRTEDEDLLALRARHQVKLVEENDVGFGVDSLPTSVYGFTWSPHVEAPLFRMRGFQSFEMHKLADSSVEIVGYVNESDAARLSDVKDYMDVTVYPDKWKEAVKLVSIPRDRILRSKGPSRNEGNGLRLELGPLNETVN